MTFPIANHSLRPDKSMNFQLNRWFGWVNELDIWIVMTTRNRIGEAE